MHVIGPIVVKLRAGCGRTFSGCDGPTVGASNQWPKMSMKFRPYAGIKASYRATVHMWTNDFSVGEPKNLMRMGSPS